MKYKPKTRYPLNLERSYANNVIKTIDELNDIVLYEFDKHLTREIDSNSIKGDSAFIEDGLFDVVKRFVQKITTLSLGAISNKFASRIISKQINSVSSFNKANINAQLAARTINPLSSEPWLNDYVKSKIQENVSYVTTIRDDYTSKIEQIVYRGVTGGQSSAEIRDELVKQAGISSDKASFIARDQTGTILGQMNAKRQQRAGFPAFKWSDSGDERVRASHRERNGKVYFYADNPLLPGEEYNCRCVAEPMDEDDLKAEGIEFGLTNDEEHALNSYVSSESYRINEKLRNGVALDSKDIKFRNNLDQALKKLAPYDGELSRSLFFGDSKDLVNFTKKFNIGGVVKFPEYLSSTYRVYSEQDSLRFVIINSNSGRDLGSYNKSEKEVLFPRDTLFKVKDRYIFEGKPLIVLEEYHE